MRNKLIKIWRIILFSVKWLPNLPKSLQSKTKSIRASMNSLPWLDNPFHFLKTPIIQSIQIIVSCSTLSQKCTSNFFRVFSKYLWTMVSGKSHFPSIEDLNSKNFNQLFFPNLIKKTFYGRLKLIWLSLDGSRMTRILKKTDARLEWGKLQPHFGFRTLVIIFMSSWLFP